MAKKLPKELRPDGFGGLELLLVVAVVLLVGGIGTYVYSHNHSGSGLFGKKPAAGQGTNPGTSTSPNGVPGGATAPASTPGATGHAITVSEGGFQITVPDSLQDLTYRVVSHSGGVMVLAFSTKRLTAAIPSCAATSGNGAFQTILKGSGGYPGPANPSSGGLLKQYDGYYLAYNLPNAPCAKGLSVDNQNLLDDQAQDFYSALATVK